ncbi:gamma-glutamyltranspeptidase [Evansella vedderi]|uniref:Gamma-glutamyltranspeptidase n=1 Tax=Evansella vedderi TaxID=38282 RepID=A0ABT9ZNN7_9BACI|nr:gamma-glutamyltransferase [Evansella vedderi]MDQ0252846.1 gamma-glutamyltranspeptidase [Evansella vedderi]
MSRKKCRRLFCVFLVLLLLLPVNVVGFAQGFDYDETFSNPYFEQQPVATGTGGAVASEHPLASQAAMDIMEAGGNAIDAAIAAHAVHNLTRPFSGGIGGGGMMNIYLAELDEVVTIGHRSMSPEAFNIDSFIDEDGNILPSESRMSSGMAVGVPGAVKAWEEALEQYGTMTFAEVLAPAIRYAREGFAADDNLIREIRENASRFRLYEPTRELFLTEDGQVPEPGTIMKNPDLANAFELIAEHGSTVFYYGEIGEAIVEAVTNPPYVDNPESQWRQDLPLPIPGVMTMEDLASYTTVHSSPIHTTYRGYDVYGMPPVSSGGLIIGGLLNILEGYDLSSMSETEFLHYYIEASRLVFADYRNYHGDPDHVHVPVDGMMSKSYAEYLRQKIGDTAKVGQVAPGNVWPYDEDPNRPAIPLPKLEPGFSYDFAGAAGEDWEKTKFYVDTSYDTTYELDGNGFGRMEIGARRNSAGRAASNMIWTEDMEILVPFRINDFGGDRRLRFWLRADGWNLSSSPHNGYAVEIRSGSDEIHLLDRVNGSGGTIARFDHERTTDIQWLRFKVVDNQLSVKLWNDGEEEPSRWNFVHEDNSLTEPGRLLISTVELANTTEGGAFTVGPIVLEETDELSMAPGFFHQFTGNAGDPWDEAVFTVEVREPTVIEQTGDGYGRITLGDSQHDYGRAAPKMLPAKNMELTVPYKINDLGSSRTLRFWLRADDWASNTFPENGYSVEIKSGFNNIRIHKAQNGSQGEIARFHYDRSTEEQMLRFKLVDNQISVKVWDASEPEPRDWNFVYVDEDNPVLGEGTFKVSAYEFTNGAGGSFTIGDIHVEETDKLTLTEPGFSYDFAGNEGDSWSGEKFSTLTTRDASQTLTGDGNGRIHLFGNTSYGNAIANMKLAKNKEVVLPFQFNDLAADSDPHLRLWLRADEPSPTISPRNGIGVDIRPNQNRIRLVRAVNGSNTWFQDISFDGGDEKQMLRFKVVDEQISVKVWNASEGEPNEWTFVTEEPSVDRLGSFMIGAYEFGNAGADIRIGKIDIMETNERTVVGELEPGFTYDFAGNAGDPWDASKFFTLTTRDASQTLSGDGYGIMNLPRNASYANGAANMLPARNKELLVPFRFSHLGENSNPHLRIWLRSDGNPSPTVSPSNGVGVDIRPSENRIRLIRAVNGSNTWFHNISNAGTEEEQMLRLRIVDNQLFVKIWNASEAEPSEWTYVTEENIVSDAGTLFFGAYEFGSTGAEVRLGEIQVVEVDDSGITMEITEGTSEEGETINLTVADKYGNVVVHTSTIVNIGGTGIVVPRYGFLLNNAIGNRTPISAEEGEPNAAAPRMRPLSTMSPTIIIKDGKPVFAGGAPGGLTIPNTVSKILLQYLDRGMSLPDAVESARISQENKISGETVIERFFTETQEYKELKALGHKFEISNLVQGIGSFNGIAFTEDGEKQAVAEAVRRGGGSAMAFDADPEEHRPPGEDKRKDGEHRRDGEKRRDDENRRDNENRNNNTNNGKRIGQD